MNMGAKESIHIIGIGSLGKFIAHALASSPFSPPITLLFHRPELRSLWDQAGRSIEVVTNSKSDRRGGFQVANLQDLNESPQGPIKHLIVATKTYSTLNALRLLKGHLCKDSTILFLQNGMGIIEETTQSVFRDLSTRPQYLTGVVSHGVYQTNQFSVVHAGKGSIVLDAGSHTPKSDPSIDTTYTRSSRYLVERLCATPALLAFTVPPHELLLRQLEKLVVNAVINPLTTILDCKNGQLFGSQPVDSLIHALITETSVILHSLVKSSSMFSESYPGFARLTSAVLEEMVSTVAKKTAQNISSMRQDALAGRNTEIDYINGYLVARGADLGLDTRLNRTLVQMVKDRRTISKAEVPIYFSLEKHGL